MNTDDLGDDKVGSRTERQHLRNPTLDGQRSVSQARYRNINTRQQSEAECVGLAYARGIGKGASVDLLEQRLVGYVNHEFLVQPRVVRRILPRTVIAKDHVHAE